MATTRLIGRTMLAAAALAGAALTPALAGAEPAPAPADSLINLSAYEEGRAGTHRTAVLTCDPNGGTHPNADVACAKLAGADGKFQDLGAQNNNKACPMDYRPVTYTAEGTWRGKPVEFEQKFANDCVAAAHTGEVFKF